MTPELEQAIREAAERALDPRSPQSRAYRRTRARFPHGGEEARNFYIKTVRELQERPDMPTYPSREEFREFAHEEAKIRVSALLQAFALPQVDEEQIHKLLVDAISNAYIAGYANGWDASLDAASEAVGKVEGFSPR